MRLLIVQRLGLFGLAQIVAAFAAEAIVRESFGAALRAGLLEFPPTLSAELVVLRILCLTLGAVHFPLPWKRTLHYESLASSSSAFVTHPSAPHSL
jgi:hypothetical protein